VLSRAGRAADPQDSGWRDTVAVPAGVETEIPRLTGYRGRFVFHCHLEHEDMAMMANLRVV
jgi:spore coat protein A